MQYASFNVHSWIKGCRGLTAANEGYYIRLCMAIYDNDGPLEANYNKLRMCLDCGTTDEAQEVVENLISIDLIYEEDGCISNIKCDKVLEKALETSQKLSDKATEREARKRELKDKKRLKTIDVDQPATTTLPRLTTKGKGKSKREGKQESILSEFESIWLHYRKIKNANKKAALAAYRVARKKASYEDISKPLGEYIRFRTGQDHRYTVHLKRWFTDERWNNNQEHAANAKETSDSQLDGLMASTDAQLDNLFPDRKAITQ